MQKCQHRLKLGHSRPVHAPIVAGAATFAMVELSTGEPS
jgi:hypothetical protein